ncbi:MAG: HAMP domain-containing histidine kinase [Lachnospiraceae bacterium]|nr:HAMP domain-containing histidine kinase [Lachnospiraceae bacterium]
MGRKSTIKRQKNYIHMRPYFIFLVFLILGIAIVGESVVETILARHFQIRELPTILWLLGVVLIIGVGISFCVHRLFLRHISKLGRAMNRIMAGDFDTRIEINSNVQEIRDIYNNFNLMAKGLGTMEMLQNDFVSNVSHEFKTPLNAIEGYVTLLEDRSLSPEEQEEYVEKILLNTHRLSELVGNILLLSKVEHQAIQEKKSQYRLDEQIRQAILSLEPKWIEQEIEFDVEMDEVLYYGNESMMMHVWTNLIGNAIKFSRVGGGVTIRLSQFGEEIRFSVSDTGVGMSAEEKKHIFDKFYQGDTSRKSEGNGLGLALVMRILRMSGGRISVQSEPGKGSCFSVFLLKK